MKHQVITSLQDFRDRLQQNPDLYLLIYKKGSEQSDCALSNLEALEIDTDKPLFSVNVAEVGDVHPEYQITTAPVVIEFQSGKPGRQLKGCHQPGSLESFFKPATASAGSGNGKKQKQVIVYTTPTCSWCRTLKEYLKSHQIGFKEIDVTKDARAAEEMVRRSGQQGVPQSLIDGQVVVGFDRNRINALLGIS